MKASNVLNFDNQGNFDDHGNFDGPKNGNFDGNFEKISIAEKNW